MPMDLFVVARSPSGRPEKPRTALEICAAEANDSN